MFDRSFFSDNLTRNDFFYWCEQISDIFDTPVQVLKCFSSFSDDKDNICIMYKIKPWIFEPKILPSSWTTESIYYQLIQVVIEENPKLRS